MMAALACLIAGAGAIGWASGAVQAPATTSAAAAAPVTGDPRVDALLARMSLADKLRLLDWAAGPSRTAVLPGVPRLGIPPLHLAEGPLGTAAHPAPAMAAPLAVAATFSQADAYANGTVLGRDAQALGQRALARPFASLDRNPATDPPAATFGEDPVLAGRTAAAEITGVQATGTMALVQGYPAGGSGTGLVLGSAALHELYLQPFEDAVRAGAAGLLCPAGTLSIVSAPGASPRPPAPPVCGDAGLLTQIRRELGFSGFVVADQGANPPVVSFDSGLDGGISGARAGAYLTPAAVRAAVASGTIGVATINQAAGAVLAEMDRFGMLGRASRHKARPEPAAAGERVVERTAQDAATLLKNAGRVLPLTAGELGSLALIGPGAQQVIGAGPGGGNGTGSPSLHPGTLRVLRRDLAADHAARVSFAVGDDMTGTPVPASALTHNGQPGLVRTTAGTGATHVVRALDNTVATGDPLPAGSAHTWTGELTVPVTGTYWVNLATGGASAALTLDDRVVAQDRTGLPGQGGVLLPTTDGLRNLRASVTLTAGTHTLGVSETPDGSGQPVQVRLDWVTPAQRQANLAAAVAAARAAKAAVVFAWSAVTTAGAGTALPDGQDQLIEDVAAVNPDTIVVLNTPGPVAMPWLSRVKAVLEMWYPGDAGGSATANVLLGRADPAGRLPVTWPAPSAQGAPARAEGILVGYRWYDRNGVAPLFPFGYGLSYTHFTYSGLTWQNAPGGGLAVRFSVTDSGRLAGDEVPQVYLGAPGNRPPGAAFAPKALAAYTRISLRAGQTTAVTLHIPLRQLQYWDDATGWVTAAGRRPLDVGPSERASALSTTVTIP
jgi:beta-glucosidase